MAFGDRLIALLSRIVAFVLPREQLGRLSSSKKSSLQVNIANGYILMRGSIKREQARQRISLLCNEESTNRRIPISTNLRGDILEIVEIRGRVTNLALQSKSIDFTLPDKGIIVERISTLEARLRQLYRTFAYRQHISTSQRWSRRLAQNYRMTSIVRIRRTSAISVDKYCKSIYPRKIAAALQGLDERRSAIIIFTYQASHKNGTEEYNALSRLQVQHFPPSPELSQAAISSTDAVELLTARFSATRMEGRDLYACFLPLGAGCNEHEMEVVSRLSAQFGESADIVYTDRRLVPADATRPATIDFLPGPDTKLMLQIDYISDSAFIKVNERQIRALGVNSNKSFEQKFIEYLFGLALTGAKISHIALPLITISARSKYRNYWALRTVRLARPSISVFAQRSTGFERRKIRDKRKTMQRAAIIIPTHNKHQLLAQCIRSINERTQYRNFEILVVDNRSDDPEALNYIATLERSPKVRVLKDPREFNYSRINNTAAKLTDADILVFLNNDTEVISGEWLEVLVQTAAQPETGAAGALLLYPSGRIQHAGVALGIGGIAGHIWRNHMPAETERRNKFMHALLTRQMSAVTGACMAIDRLKFTKAGGFNEKSLPVAFNDVDLCLRLTKMGYSNIYCHDAVLYHHESASRGSDISPTQIKRLRKEEAFMRTRWSHMSMADPAYNTNLTLSFEDLSIRS